MPNVYIENKKPHNIKTVPQKQYIFRVIKIELFKKRKEKRKFYLYICIVHIYKTSLNNTQKFIFQILCTLMIDFIIYSSVSTYVRLKNLR